MPCNGSGDISVMCDGWVSCPSQGNVASAGIQVAGRRGNTTGHRVSGTINKNTVSEKTLVLQEVIRGPVHAHVVHKVGDGHRLRVLAAHDGHPLQVHRGRGLSTFQTRLRLHLQLRRVDHSFKFFVAKIKNQRQMHKMLRGIKHLIFPSLSLSANRNISSMSSSLTYLN